MNKSAFRFLLPSLLLVLASCGDLNRQKKHTDSANAAETTVPKCPVETGGTVLPVNIRIEGNSTLCTCSLDGNPEQSITRGRINTLRQRISGDALCVFFRVAGGSGTFRAQVSLNGKTQTLEQELMANVDFVQQNFPLSVFGIAPATAADSVSVIP